MKQTYVKNVLKRYFSLLAIPLLAVIFCGCNLYFDPSGLKPKIFIESDGLIQYDEVNDLYNLELLPGETYLINANLGDYDESEYFIDYAPENEETDVLSIEDNVVKISSSAETEQLVVVLVRLRKTDDETIYSSVKINIKIVSKKSAN